MSFIETRANDGIKPQDFTMTNPLINFGTGSGKTHMLFQSMYEAIQKYPDIQIIGVYVAPLREHLNIHDSLKKQYPEIPVYTINSLDMKTTAEHLGFYKKWIKSIPPIEIKDNLTKAKKEDLTQKSNYLDRHYVYNAYKSIINIMEISRYQNQGSIYCIKGLKEHI